MIFQKNFNIISKLKWIVPMLGVVAALYGIMLLGTMYGARFYTHYVPNENRVAGVYLSFEGPAPYRDSVSTDRGTIAGAVALHEMILDIRSDLTRDEISDMDRSDRRDVRREQRDHRGDMRDAFWQSATGGGTQFAENGGQHLYITYQLDNGDWIYRRYALPATFIQHSGLQSLITNGIETPLPYPVFGNPDVVESVHLRFYLPDEAPFELTVNEEAQIVSLLNALRQDMADDAGDGDIFLVVSIAVQGHYWDQYHTPNIYLRQIGNTMALLAQQM